MLCHLSGVGAMRSNLKEQWKMIEPKKREITTLIRCDNENCGGVCFTDELEQSDWRCPYCGKPISKPE